MKVLKLLHPSGTLQEQEEYIDMALDRYFIACAHYGIHTKACSDLKELAELVDRERRRIIDYFNLHAIEQEVKDE